ncbi:hypothetical protein BCR36DRAFT_338528 [Piromyces finnis]|uniref:DUF3533 domain-containing protein n=1 Tax=Piromyces finnis TaxID=1754191 RepID=A0A1Y1UV22_9FUNG|nr:hypothetical protein BCR36DRAFT_338528 [Piromyces finnis]|eukprot:ORX41878.1 hypothetical protein BCR36DRAFT_338528 [Piromyces finnis]
MSGRNNENEMISYDKVDPLPTENPFYYNENSKLNSIIKEKEKKIPYIHLGIFLLVIPLLSFLMGLFYIGGIWNPIEKIPDVKYIIVNDDAGCINNESCTQMLGMLNSTTLGSFYTKLNDNNHPAGTFEYMEGSRNDAIEKVEKHKNWVSLYVPKNFTMLVLGNLNLMPGAANSVVVEEIYDEARSYTTVQFLKKALDKAKEAFFNSIAAKVEQYGSFKPQFLISGIEYKEVNLYPVPGFGQNFSSFISFILLWIGTIATALITHFVFPLENHWVEKKDVSHPILKTIGAKTLTNGIIMFAICVIVSVIPLCCGTVEMYKGYAALLFFFFFFSLCGLGVNNCLVHLFHFINFYLIAVTFMILQFISCGGLLHQNIQYGFFKIGKAFPMFYAVRELKYIYFGSGKHTQTANVLIILAWTVVSLPISLFLYYLELKNKRAKINKNTSN